MITVAFTGIWQPFPELYSAWLALAKRVFVSSGNGYELSSKRATQCVSVLQMVCLEEGWPISEASVHRTITRGKQDKGNQWFQGYLVHYH